MNEIKIGELTMGYSDKVKKYNILDKVIIFAESIRKEVILNNNIPCNSNDNYIKFMNKRNIQMGYKYHGNDVHEYALLKFKNGKPIVIDRAYATISFMEDENEVYVIFECKGERKYEKYSPIRKAMKLNINIGTWVNLATPMEILSGLFTNK